MGPNETEEPLSMLIERILNGEKELYRMVVTRYQERLFRFLLIFCRDRDVAEEACQNALIKAYNFLKNYDPNFKFENWLISIALNEARTFIKKNRRMVLTGDFNNIPSRLPATESAAEKNESMNAVREAILDLPFAYRSAVVLRYYGERSYEEIGEIMSANINTVKTWLNRAKQILKLNLEKTGLSYEE